MPFIQSNIGCFPFKPPHTNRVLSHVVFVAKGTSENSIYINGEPQALTASSWDDNTTINPTSTRIKEYYSTGEGQIDEIRVYNRALGAREVKKLYEWAPGPVAYWKMDEGSGTSINDHSGNGNICTLNGATWTTGKYGSGVSFDGDNDDATCGSSLTTSSQGAIEYWLKLTGDENGSAFHFYESAATDYIRSYFSSSNNLIDLVIEDDNSPQVNVNYDLDDLSGDFLDRWMHIAWVQDGTAAKLYIDGSEKTLAGTNSGGWWDDHLSLSTVRLGFGWDWLNGTLDDFKVYDYARTSDQIIEDMNAGHPAGGSPVGSPVAYWRFNEGYGDTAHDEIGDNDGTLDADTGGTNTTETEMWSLHGKFGKAIELDGTDDVVTVTDSDALDVEGSFTASAWVKNTYTGNGWDRIFSKKTSWTDALGWEVSLASAPSVGFEGGDFCY